MNKYYTTIETHQNGQQFFGVVYESVSNQQIFKTSTHSTHTKVVQEVNEFLKSKLSSASTTQKVSESSSKTPTPPTTVQIQNTIKPVTITGSIPSSGRRCCGR